MNEVITLALGQVVALALCAVVYLASPDLRALGTSSPFSLAPPTGDGHKLAAFLLGAVVLELAVFLMASWHYRYLPYFLVALVFGGVGYGLLGWAGGADESDPEAEMPYVGTLAISFAAISFLIGLGSLGALLVMQGASH